MNHGEHGGHGAIQEIENKYTLPGIHAFRNGTGEYPGLVSLYFPVSPVLPLLHIIVGIAENR